MKRKTLILLLALTLAVCVFAAAVFADDNVVQVTTAEDLNNKISEYAGSPKYIQLTEDITAADITLTQDVYLDLNGCDITTLTVNGDYTLYCMDSQTDDYTVEDSNGYGKIGSVSGNVAAVPAGTVSAVETVGDGEEKPQAQCGYLMVTDTEDNSVSFHRVYAEISAMWLRARTTIEESGMYYSGIFEGDEIVAENVTYFGVATSVTNLATDKAWTTGLKDSMAADAAGTEGARKVLYSSYTDAEFESKKEYKDTCMYNIMSTEYGPAQNKSRAAMKVYGRAYLMAGDQVVFGQNTRDHSFRSLTEGLDDYYTTSIHTTYPNIINMYQKAGVTAIMNGWDIPYIKAGAESIEQTLLSRRDTVTQYMSDMMNVKWSVVEDITYTVEGAGDIALPAYDSQGNQIVYQGVPYTDGNGSLDAWKTYSVSTDNEVHTLYGLSAESLKGTSAGQGNNSANAVYWAWSQVSDTISFDDVADMTSQNGCVMLDSYSELNNGDALVQYNDGRAMLVTQVTIAKNADGSIDSANSYVVTLEQSSDKELTANTNASGTAVYALAEGGTYTFDALSTKGFQPVTCVELQSASESKAQPKVTYENDTVNSNLPMEYVKVTVTRDNTDGGVTKESYVHEKDGATSITLPTASEIQTEVNKLGSGTYTVTYQCKLAGENALQTVKTETQTVAANADYEVYYLDSLKDANGNVTGYFSTDVIRDAVASKTMQYYFMSGEGMLLSDNDDYKSKWGDSCLVVLPNGETLLIDVGVEEYYPILEHNLKRLGVTHIDHLVLTHPHNDHCGGAWAGVTKTATTSWVTTTYSTSGESKLLKTFSVENVYHSGLKDSGWDNKTNPHPHIGEIVTAYKDAGNDINLTVWKMNSSLEIGSGDRKVEIDVLWPGADNVSVTEELSYNGTTVTNNKTGSYSVSDGDSIASAYSGDINNRSLVLRLDYGAHSSLFTGDLYQTYKTGGWSSTYTKCDPASTNYDRTACTNNDWTDRYVVQSKMTDAVGAENAIIAYYTSIGKLDKLNVDLLKMMHHGDASSSNSRAMLSAITPELAVATGFMPVETHWSLYKYTDGTRLVDLGSYNSELGLYEAKYNDNVYFDRYNGYVQVSANAAGTMEQTSSRQGYVTIKIGGTEYTLGAKWNSDAEMSS